MFLSLLNELHQNIQPISQLLFIRHTLFIIDATYTAQLHSALWQLAFTIGRLASENSRWHGRKHAEDCGNIRRCKHRIRRFILPFGDCRGQKNESFGNARIKVQEDT